MEQMQSADPSETEGDREHPTGVVTDEERKTP
jgi:hypothetical protein